MDLIVQRAVWELLDLYNYISVAELAERIRVSESSLKHRMNEVKTMLTEQGVRLGQAIEKGIRLETSEQQREALRSLLYEIAYNTSESSEYRKDYILKTLFEYQINYTIQMFADDLFVSRNQIIRDLDALDIFLKPYHVGTVRKKNRGIWLEGNEFAIRQAVIVHNNAVWWNGEYAETPQGLDVRISDKAWTYMEKIYGEIDLLGVSKTLKQAEALMETTFTDVAFARLVEFIAVSVRRIKIKKLITEYHNDNLLPLQTRYMDSAALILKDFIDEKLPEPEIRYLAARLYVAATIRPEHREEFERCKVILYLRGVERASSGTDFSEDEQLIEALMDYIVKVRYKKNYGIKDWNDINREVKKNLSELYAVCLAQILVLESEELKFEPDDIAMIAMIINNHVEAQKKEAVFVAATDRATAVYQLNKLRRSFPEFRFEKAVHYTELREKDLAGKVIISTVKLPEEVEYIKITKHVDERDIREIEQKVNVPKAIPGIFRNLENLEVLWDLNVKDKTDAIDKICKHLKNRGYVSDTFKEAVLEREGQTPTSIGNGMAVPHVLETGINRECLMVVKLKHAVLWETYDLVDLIFLFALKERNAWDMAEMFGGFYQLISHKEAVEQMKQSEEALLKIIY